MTNRWNEKIDIITNNFSKEFGALNAEQLNLKPDSNTWSIAQNIDHLIVINESYYPVIQSIHNRSFKLPLIGKVGFLVNFFGRFILKSVQPNRKRKMKTFPMWEPSKSEIAGDILVRFQKHQTELKTLIDKCIDLLASGTVISSPVNKNIVYKLETAFDIIVTHEQRHFEQAKEVLRLFEK
jgi:hypothetical protein